MYHVRICKYTKTVSYGRLQKVLDCYHKSRLLHWPLVQILRDPTKKPVPSVKWKAYPSFILANKNISTVLKSKFEHGLNCTLGMSHSLSVPSLYPAPCWSKGWSLRTSIFANHHWKLLCLLSVRGNAWSHSGWGTNNSYTERSFLVNLGLVA